MGLPTTVTGGFNGPVKPCAGEWWASWRGDALNRRGPYNSGTAYNHTPGSLDVVTYYDGTYVEWVANNTAKNGLATWTLPSTTSDWLPISANSFQEFDIDVAATTILKGNWNARDNGVAASESLGGDVLPTSLYRSGTPSWFGTLAWPAFNPANP